MQPGSTYVARMQRRATIVRALRRFFDERDFLEVDTYVAQTTLAPEPHIEAPRVEIRAQERQTRYLQTSPELLMKRLLARGLPRIYQIAVAFRDGDFSKIHRPEFRIVEWYRAGASWTDLMDDCEGLVRATAAAVGHTEMLPFGGRTIPIAEPFRRVSVDAAFVQHAGFSILEAPTESALRAALRQRDIFCSDHDSWDDLFHRIFLSIVEPALLADPRPLFLTHYPVALAALARPSPEDPRVAERFELYLGGLELANAFGELTDANEQRQRFKRDAEARKAAGMHDYPPHEHFFSALAQLGPCAGIALGLERLFMVLQDADDIDAVSFIGWSES